MKRIFTAALVTLSLGAFASSASATTFTLTDYSVSARTTDPGLVMWVDELLATDYTFDLENVGDAQTVELFELGSRETWGNMGEDSTPYPISVGFTFSAPVFGAGGSTATGNTAGLFFLGGVLWNSPLVMTFGTTGILGIFLEDAIFGLPGSTGIDATFKLLQQDVSAAPVPEPASMILFGSGLAAGAAMLRRRRSRRAA
jgi:hypothetical protein